ncbi:hypothetical protein R6258_09610 [Halomonas sp. HP20-15]|uniref:hypothetical protein n=1 Tax=Halomonas sp. HP20-15 TaxID=3085901 RepID=UPI0029829024|nr:hypothetical protein [Halomonas sp. HP20-15]MDW5377169.1 hypothetical protein [Halomonas sp. HP20-15]
MSIELPNDTAMSPSALGDAANGASAAETALAGRLARAKANLDRLERDVASKDHSALAAARVEFALASRALADELVARGLHATPHGA